MQTHPSYLPFYCNSQETQFWKGILGRKVTVLCPEANLEPCQTSILELLYEKNQQKAVPIFAKRSTVDA